MIAIVDSRIPTRPGASPKSLSRVEELQKTVSASRLSLWQQCRLKFYFKYVRQLVKPPTPARHVGKVVHAVLQAWNKARWRREPFALERFKAVFDQGWQAEQKGLAIAWSGKESEHRCGAWSLLELYFQQSPIPEQERPEAVEVRVESDLSRRGFPRLIGIIDLVRAGARIVDFKTAAATPNPETAAWLHETQTSAYAVLYREATGQKESAIELHHLVKLKTPKLVVTSVGTMSDRQEGRLFRVMESYVEGIGRLDFVPSPGLLCTCCEYQRECRAWTGKEAP